MSGLNSVFVIPPRKAIPRKIRFRISGSGENPGFPKAPAHRDNTSTERKYRNIIEGDSKANSTPFNSAGESIRPEKLDS